MSENKSEFLNGNDWQKQYQKMYEKCLRDYVKRELATVEEIEAVARAWADYCVLHYPLIRKERHFGKSRIVFH